MSKLTKILSSSKLVNSINQCRDKDCNLNDSNCSNEGNQNNRSRNRKASTSVTRKSVQCKYQSSLRAESEYRESSGVQVSNVVIQHSKIHQKSRKTPKSTLSNKIPIQLKQPNPHTKTQTQSQTQTNSQPQSETQSQTNESELKQHLQKQFKMRLDSVVKGYELKLVREQQTYELKEMKYKEEIEYLKRQVRELVELKRSGDGDGVGGEVRGEGKGEHCGICSNGEIINFMRNMLQALQSDHKNCLTQKTILNNQILQLQQKYKYSQLELQQLQSKHQKLLKQQKQLKSQKQAWQRQKREKERQIREIERNYQTKELGLEQEVIKQRVMQRELEEEIVRVRMGGEDAMGGGGGIVSQNTFTALKSSISPHSKRQPLSTSLPLHQHSRKLPKNFIDPKILIQQQQNQSQVSAQKNYGYVNVHGYENQYGYDGVHADLDGKENRQYRYRNQSQPHYRKYKGFDYLSDHDNNKNPTQPLQPSQIPNRPTHAQPPPQTYTDYAKSKRRHNKPHRQPLYPGCSLNNYAQNFQTFRPAPSQGRGGVSPYVTVSGGTGLREGLREGMGWERGGKYSYLG